MRHSVAQKYRLVEKQTKQWSETSKASLEQSIGALQRNQLLALQKKNGNYYPMLTKEGKKLAREYYVDTYGIAKQKPWGKKWRVVIFDIPLEFGAARNSIRYQLRRLGFCMLQQSVWVHPLSLALISLTILSIITAWGSLLGFWSPNRLIMRSI
ncbi:MAG: DNA-binding transcriptional regulator PaaX [Planctomycetota bacterium]|jgi:DNA-binding transcriptional regulator PaaX